MDAFLRQLQSLVKDAALVPLDVLAFRRLGGLALSLEVHRADSQVGADAAFVPGVLQDEGSGLLGGAPASWWVMFRGGHWVQFWHCTPHTQAWLQSDRTDRLLRSLSK